MGTLKNEDLATEKIAEVDTPRRGFRKKVIMDRAGKEAYLVRWTLFTLPWLGWELKLHKILRPDSEVCSHCHPWSFTRLILKGRYWETRGEDKKTMHEVSGIWPKHCPADFLHSIRKTENDAPVWTLVMTYGVQQGWGFLTSDGLLPWRTFVDASPETRVAWCEEGNDEENANGYDEGNIVGHADDGPTSFRAAIDSAAGQTFDGTKINGYA